MSNSSEEDFVLENIDSEYDTDDDDSNSNCQERDDNLCDLVNWSKEDKQNLLKALKKYGSSNFTELSKATGKTSEEVNDAIEYYRALADDELKKSVDQRKLTVCQNRQKLYREKFLEIPLYKWIKLLLKKYSIEELQNEIADAFHIIAECENFPTIGRYTQYIDVKMLYKYLACAIEGRDLPELDKATSTIFCECLQIVASKSKKAIKYTNYLRFNNKISMTDPYNRVTSKEMEKLRELATETRLNPFNTPEGFMIKDL